MNLIEAGKGMLMMMPQTPFVFNHYMAMKLHLQDCVKNKAWVCTLFNLWDEQ